MLSYWELDSFVDYDVIIVGAGITGLSSAISILEKQPDLNVLILERNLFPTGASTKNAGFACFGSLTELLSDIEQMGTIGCLTLVEQRWKGLQKLRSRFADKELGFEPLGGYELMDQSREDVMTKMDQINELLYPLFGADVYRDVSEKLNDFGFNTDKFSRLIFNAFEGQIHTGKTIAALWRLASKLGVKILTGARVEIVEGNTVIVNQNGADICFKGNKIVLCTNAFTSRFFPDLEMLPGRGQVMITEPIGDLKFKGTFHIEEGYYYFRNVGERVLLGGGRHLDFKGEETLKNGIHPEIEKELIRKLKEEILPNQKFEIAQKWSGIMAFGEVKKPILEWVTPEILLAVRLGGMGMAIGSELGELVSIEIQNQITK